MKIGFIGLGNMGSGMAANILKANYPLVVNSRRQESAKSLLQAGAQWAETPKDVAETSDMVFTSLPGPPEVQAVALGAYGIIEGIKPGLIYIDVSSNSPTVIRNIYSVFKEKGAHVLDAPVSGGPPAARAGKLALMVGGDEDVFKQCKPVLDVLGDKVSYAGKIGCGSICKLMHNCIVYGLQTIIAECFTLGVKAGVEPKKLFQAVAGGGVGQGTYFSHVLPATYLKGRFEPPNFALRLAFKDVDLATALGREFNVPMSVGNLTLNELMSAMNRGWGGKDSRAAMLLQEERAGGIQVRIPEEETKP